MWINTALNHQTSNEMPHIAVVTSIENGEVNTQSHMLGINLPVVSSVAVQSLPQVGDEVVIIPTSDGKYYCIGKVVTDVADGEVKISASSGAYIKLLADGRISLNGLMISKGGVLNGN